MRMQDEQQNNSANEKSGKRKIAHLSGRFHAFQTVAAAVGVVDGSRDCVAGCLKGFYPSRGNFITVVGRWDQGGWIKQLKSAMKGSTALPVYSFRGPASLPGVDYSDHRNYWPHGIQRLGARRPRAFFKNRRSLFVCRPAELRRCPGMLPPRKPGCGHQQRRQDQYRA